MLIKTLSENNRRVIYNYVVLQNESFPKFRGWLFQYHSYALWYKPIQISPLFLFWYLIEWKQRFYMNIWFLIFIKKRREVILIRTLCCWLYFQPWKAYIYIYICIYIHISFIMPQCSKEQSLNGRWHYKGMIIISSTTCITYSSQKTERAGAFSNRDWLNHNRV